MPTNFSPTLNVKDKKAMLYGVHLSMDELKKKIASRINNHP
jgi:hypothetical protein